MAKRDLDPTLDNLLDQMGVTAERKARFSEWTGREQVAALTALEVLVPAGRSRREVARLTVELKQAKDSQACLNQELKKVHRELTRERKLGVENQKRIQKFFARQEREIERQQKKKRLKKVKQKLVADKRQEKRDLLRVRIRRQRLQRQYQDLLARLAEFRRAAQTWEQVRGIGVSDVRRMCGRIKTEAKKLGSRVPTSMD